MNFVFTVAVVHLEVRGTFEAKATHILLDNVTVVFSFSHNSIIVEMQCLMGKLASRVVT